ncbi:hypothetical protein [Arenimonas alkanexedens]
MTKQEFEALLEKVATKLTDEAQQKLFDSSKAFESRVRKLMAELGQVEINFDPHPYAFPDISVGEFGVEVKFTVNDTWRCVANSVLETVRDHEVKHVYVLLGKMGNTPEVRWADYEKSVIHVRTSHVPRFEVELLGDEAGQSLFEKMGVKYSAFSHMPMEEKMGHIRAYARSRLKPGERFWWLEDRPEQEHTLSLQVKLYMNLSQEEKRKLRAEAALLCPQIVKASRAKNKYNDAVMYILTYHGVLCPQARDLFSAGSVALRADSERGGNYVERALRDIEEEMLDAAKYLEDALFVEYWGKAVKPKERIKYWLKQADSMARDWTPSDSLFQ